MEIRVSWLFLLLVGFVHPVEAFDWGDFHKVAVIFFSFFGPILILGAIVAVAYLACIKSWYEGFREDVRQTHRSFHPWPPGSAKWQLQQYIRSGRSEPKKTPEKPLPPSPHQISSVSEKMEPPPISPGYLQSPIPQGYYQSSNQPFSVMHPLPSIVIPDRKSSDHPIPELSPRPSQQEYLITSPGTQTGSNYLLAPSFSMLEQHHMAEMARSNKSPEPMEAVTIRTTTTTRRTTVLSPVNNRKQYTIV